MGNFGGIMKRLSITPKQAVRLFSGIRLFDWLTSGPSGTSNILQQLMSADLTGILDTLRANAQSVFSGGTKFKELMQIILRDGLLTVLISFAVDIGKSIKSGS